MVRWDVGMKASQNVTGWYDRMNKLCKILLPPGAAQSYEDENERMVGSCCRMSVSVHKYQHGTEACRMQTRAEGSNQKKKT